MKRDLDAAIEYLAITCACAACERLRALRLRRVSYYAARLKEQLP